MKRNILAVLLVVLSGSLLAQKWQRPSKSVFVQSENAFYGEIKKGINDYNTPKKEPRMSFKMDYTGVDIPKSKDEFTTAWCNDPLSQGRTGTCWCFSTSSFYEAEIFRLTKQEIKLSELFTVYYEFIEKAREYIRTRGESYFGEGSETNAVARMMKQYGIVPQADYSGMKDDQPFHDHAAMFEEMSHYLNTLKRDNAWNESEGLATIKSILNYYIGEPPISIEYKGKTYTPLQFLNDVTKLKLDDYVDFMSLLQKPYYTQAEYKVPDNWWRSDVYYNAPLDDFMAVIRNAITNGYTLSIGGDVSESGYSPDNDIAMIPTYDIPSKYIDENARQLRFSNGSTTDDHAIHLMGYKKGKVDTALKLNPQTGVLENKLTHNMWYLIKDSGSGARNGKNKGYYFYHEDYIKLKTMTYTVHKDAAKEILKKFNK